MTWNRHPLASLVSRTDGDGIDLTDAKLFLRVDHTTENDLIEAMIASSRVWVETYLRRSLITETWDFKFRDFPHVVTPLYIPRAPLQSVTSISYLDENAASQTWASGNYAVRTLSGPNAGRGWIETTADTDYPTTSTESEYPVTVRAVCGYGSATAIPKGIKSAMLLLLGDLYAQRQETITGTMSAKTQTTIEKLLGPYRLPEAV
jgi:uncharacterized phiE125 gp8 family phage protein